MPYTRSFFEGSITDEIPQTLCTHHTSHQMKKNQNCGKKRSTSRQYAAPCEHRTQEHMCAASCQPPSHPERRTSRKTARTHDKGRGEKKRGDAYRNQHPPVPGRSFLHGLAHKSKRHPSSLTKCSLQRLLIFKFIDLRLLQLNINSIKKGNGVERNQAFHFQHPPCAARVATTNAYAP